MRWPARGRTFGTAIATARATEHTSSPARLRRARRKGSISIVRTSTAEPSGYRERGPRDGVKLAPDISGISRMQGGPAAALSCHASWRFSNWDTTDRCQSKAVLIESGQAHLRRPRLRAKNEIMDLSLSMLYDFNSLKNSLQKHS